MKDIKNYEGIYKIAEDGKVWSCITNKFLKTYIHRTGYRIIKLKKKHLYIHRLVGLAYIDNPENKPDLNHKDGNKLNNIYTNLEWVTKKENNNHASTILLINLKANRIKKHRFTKEQILKILEMHNSNFSNKAIAKELNADCSSIGRLITNFKSGKQLRALK